MEAIVNEQYLPPVVFNLDVSGRCQFRCVHCHHRRKQVHDKQLPDLPKRLADTLPYFLRHWHVNGSYVLACCIVGSQGDALLYAHLPKLLKELYFAGIEIGLVTNGFGFTDELIDYAVHYTKFIGFSMDAGTPDTYKSIKNSPPHAWVEVCESIARVTEKLDDLRLRNDVGWKILVLPQNQHEIYKSCAVAKSLGCRYVQIRPADLPAGEVAKISIGAVEEQIERAIDELEEPGTFEIVGIRHKFSPEYKKVLPQYCHMTPLTVTITSDGKAYACVDRRCDKSIMLVDCSIGGWAGLKSVWGSPHHVRIVHKVINRDGEGPACDIRCSNYGYDRYFRNYIIDDNVDWKLI
jgi:wyosine [tRNA(Phe)-imidazoG37] synthetase (radical SAM superfamily)